MTATVTPPDMLSSLPAAIAASIKLRLPSLRECKGMAGRLDVEAVKKKGIAAPAVLVARLRLIEAESHAGPLTTFRVQMAAFILTKDELNLPRHDAASNIAQAILSFLPGATWGLDEGYVRGAERIQEEPLVSGGSEGAAIAISVVTWDHVTSLTPAPEVQILPIELYLGGIDVTAVQIGGAE